MNLTLETAPDCITVRLDEPRFDATMALPFKERMREVIGRAAPATLVIDMGQVQFMDSSGLGALIAIHKALPPGRPMQLEGVQPNVLRVLRLTRMDTVFSIRPAAQDGAVDQIPVAPPVAAAPDHGTAAP